MGLLKDIQNDIVNESMSAGAILRKAQILSYNLEYEEFQNWVDMELNGYAKESEDFDAWSSRLPAYRIIHPRTYADVYTNFNHNPRTIISPELIQLAPQNIRLVYLDKGVPSLEKLLESGGNELMSPWPDYIIQVFNEQVLRQGEVCSSINNYFPKTEVMAILETVKNRLLKFTLELLKANPMLDENHSATIPESQISQIYHITIAPGASMSIFDQNNQSVQGNQYNAAGDMNFNNITNINELTDELETLLNTLQVSLPDAEIEEDEKLDLEYNLKKAIQQTKSETPNTSKLVEYLSKSGMVQIPDKLA
jgi:hypothetical protein